ncbi:MAG: vanadium-dependent haloperoxidase [Panacibacter sp.]
MKRYLLAAISAMFILVSCKENTAYIKEIHDPFLYSKTVKKLNDIVLENNFPPMVASRNYVYANIAAYEVMVAGDSNYISLSGQIKTLPPMPKPDPSQKIDFPFASMIAFCKVGNAVTFPEGSMDTYVDELKQKVKDAGMPSGIFENSIDYSNKVADSILSWSKKDNYAETRSATKFTVTNDEGRWVPTPPMYGQAVEPHWMEIRPMVLDSAAEFKPVRPPKYDPKNKSSEYYQALMYVKKEVDSLTPDQKHIADFWDDNPFKLNVSGHVMYGTKKFSPPGHWMNIVGILSQKKQADFSETVYAYTKAAIALFDGFISAWDEKFRSNYIRPETVINKYYDPEWRPYIQTPPFPEYTSAHAVISAAAAEVMTDIYGDNISYTDTSESEFGIPPLSFTSVRNAAKEAAISRVYGGIHYKHSCDIGNQQGIALGQFVIQRLRMKKK